MRRSRSRRTSWSDSSAAAPTISERSPAAEPAQRVHLPHAFLRGEIALREQEIVLIGCGDVRFAQPVKRNRDLLRDGGRDRPRRLRQRAPGNPVDAECGQNDQNRDGYVDIFEEPIQAH